MKRSMVTNTLKLFCITLLFAFFCTPVSAHYPWITIHDHTPETGTPLAIAFGWGHQFPSDVFLKESDIENVVILGPERQKLEAGFVSEEEVRTTQGVSNPGAYIVAAQRKTGFYTKTAQGGERTSKKGLKHVIKCFHSRMCMKAVVNVGDGKGSVDTRIGHPMEIIPLKNPAELSVGGYMDIEIICDGKPFTGMVHATYSGFSTENDIFAFTAKTDKQGKAKIQILKSGIWLIKANHECPYADQNECDVESFTATLTFEIQ